VSDTKNPAPGSFSFGGSAGTTPTAGTGAATAAVGGEAHSTTFWTDLKAQAGANTLGRLVFSATFADQAAGRLPCCAIAATGATGHRIVQCNCAASKSVYFLPYGRELVTVATRADYEAGAGKADFFMTYPLTGCRFVLTKTQVLHIANNVTSGLPAKVDELPVDASKRRTAAELKVTGKGNLGRRLSVTGLSVESYSAEGDELDYGYGAENAAIVFGMDMSGASTPGVWKYVFLIQEPSSKGTAGTWTTFINP
jgi:hypothetical protein